MSVSRRDFGKQGLSLALGVAAISGMPFSARATTVPVGPRHGISIFGDLKYGSDFTHFDYANPDAPIGGEFSIGYSARPFDSLSPFILKGNPEAYMTALPYFEYLMVGSADEADSIYGLLAESVEVPLNRLFTRFNLHPEARFRDGSPVTAEDVVFSLDTLREKGRPTFKVFLKDILRAEAEDARTVRFDFDPAAPRQRLPLVAASLPVFSKVWYATRDFTESTLEPPMNSGPLEVAEVEAGRKIVYRRRDDYWGWNLPVMRGRYNFRRYRIEYFRDRSAEFEGFKGGAFTFREEFTSKVWATAYAPDNFPAIARGDVLREELPNNVPSGTQGYWINTRREKFTNPLVREAIALCFDFEWSNRTLFYGLYSRTDSFFEGGPMEAEGKISPGERRVLENLPPEVRSDLPEGIFKRPAYVPVVNDGSGRIRNVLRRAGALLDAAGWTREGEFRKNAAGETLTVDFLEDSPSLERVTAPYIRNLQRVGIKARLDLIDRVQARDRMEVFDYDIVAARLPATGLTPGTGIRTAFHSSFAESTSSANLSGLANPAVDILVDRMIDAKSRAELTDIVRALDRVLRALHIWVPQWTKDEHHIAYWDIYARPPHKPVYALGVIDLWWADAEKAARLKDKVGG